MSSTHFRILPAAIRHWPASSWTLWKRPWPRSNPLPTGHRYLRSGREDEGWRYLRIPGFKKYLVFYRLTDIEIEVVRVVHASRDLEAIFRVL